MQIRIFTLPLHPIDSEQEELNHFLRSHRIVDVKKELCLVDGGGVWTFCVTYMQEGVTESSRHSSSDRRDRKKVDYKEVLSEDEFLRFSEMRKLRKQIADSEAVPAYLVFTDSELAEIAKLALPFTEADIKKIKGIGKARADKYGSTFCSMDFSIVADEEGGQPD